MRHGRRYCSKHFKTEHLITSQIMGRRHYKSQVVSIEDITAVPLMNIFHKLHMFVPKEMPVKEMKSLLQYSSIFKEKFGKFDLEDVNVCFDAQGAVENIISSDDSVRLFGESDMFPCLICDGRVNETDIAIQCGVCSGWFHNSCTNTPVSEDALELFADLPEYVVAHCPNCYEKKASNFIDGTMLDDVRLKLSTIQDKLSDMELSLTNSKTEDESLQNRVESMKNHLSSNMEDLASVMSKVSSLQQPSSRPSTSGIQISPRNITNSAVLNRSSSSSIGRSGISPNNRRSYSSTLIRPVPGTTRSVGAGLSGLKSINRIGHMNKTWAPKTQCDKSMTIVIDNIKDYSKIKHSSIIKSNFNRYFKGMKIKSCFSTSRGNVFVELTNSKDALEVIAQWKGNFFGNDNGDSTRVTLLDNKSCQGIIRRVPLEHDDAEITEGLQSDFPGVVAKRLVSKDRGPLYSVHLTFKDKAQLETAMSNDIMLLNMVFEVDQFIKRKSVVRCFKCLRFDHPSKWCSHNITCHNCAGDHTLKECESVNTFKCINCDGAHKSTDPVCEKYKEKLAVINDLNNNG